MSAKRARQTAKRKARERAGVEKWREMKRQDQLERRRAAAHNIPAWSGPERQRKVKRLVARTRKAVREAGMWTRGDLMRERERLEGLEVAPDPTRERAINEALRRQKEDGSDDG